MELSYSHRLDSPSSLLLFTLHNSTTFMVTELEKLQFSSSLSKVNNDFGTIFCFGYFRSIKDHSTCRMSSWPGTCITGARIFYLAIPTKSILMIILFCFAHKGNISFLVLRLSHHVAILLLHIAVLCHLKGYLRIFVQIFLGKTELPIIKLEA